MLYAEDLTEGQTFKLGTYAIGEAEILAFAAKYDPVPIHTDRAAAAAGPFGGLIASGFNTMAIYQRLVVEAIWSKVAGIVGRSGAIRYFVQRQVWNRADGSMRCACGTFRGLIGSRP